MQCALYISDKDSISQSHGFNNITIAFALKRKRFISEAPKVYQGAGSAYSV
jgi:hypothetical protein